MSLQVRWQNQETRNLLFQGFRYRGIPVAHMYE